MILVDTSIWIDHLHAPEPQLIELLADDAVACHPLVVEELALGSMKDRAAFLGLLANLRALPTLSHVELLTLVERRRLWGKGLSTVDVHLLGAVALTPGAKLWTRDKRLAAACGSALIHTFDEARTA